MAREIVLDGETCDRITVLTLTEYRNYLKKELRQHKKDPAKHWLHPDDVVGNQHRIGLIDELLKDFVKVS